MTEQHIRGKLIVLEGGEGVGKDENIRHLEHVCADRADVVFTREPGGTVLGERIRSVLMDRTATEMAVETELLLFLAARAQLMQEIVRPALARGQHVIANRFGLSTVAYQIYRHERFEHRSLLDELTRHVVGEVVPHYILLDLTPEVGLARVRDRAGEVTRFDVEPTELHHRVRRGYHEAVKAYPHVIVDAARPLAEVQEAVVKHVLDFMDL